MSVFGAYIDYLIVANHVEVSGGLMYVNGAGWVELKRPANQPNHINSFGVGVSICIPWGETNQPHELTIRLENEDGGVLANIETGLTMGRPATIGVGSDQHAVAGVMFNLVFPAEGLYRVTALLNKTGEKHWAFHVRDVPTGG